MKILKYRWWRRLYNSLTVLKNAEFYILNGWIAWYVYNILIKRWALSKSTIASCQAITVLRKRIKEWSRRHVIKLTLFIRSTPCFPHVFSTRKNGTKGGTRGFYAFGPGAVSVFPCFFPVRKRWCIPGKKMGCEETFKIGDEEMAYSFSFHRFNSLGETWSKTHFNEVLCKPLRKKKRMISIAVQQCWID